MGAHTAPITLKLLQKVIFNVIDHILLFGFGSGYKALISATSIVYAHGYYSAAYADIYSEAEHNVIAQFYGHYSGYYANVWCELGTVCTVSCKGTGCLNLMVYYENSVDVVIKPMECGRSHRQGDRFEGVDCPKLMKYDENTKEEIEEERLAIRE